MEDFDHHCKWLNNCIGGQNYSQFVALIASVFAMTFGQVRHKKQKKNPPLLFSKTLPEALGYALVARV